MARGDLDVHGREIRALSRRPDVGAEVVRVANRLRDSAKRRAPVSSHGSNGRRPGYLRANISVRLGSDSHGLYADVVTTARSRRGFPYGAYQQKRRSYIRAHF